MTRAPEAMPGSITAFFVDWALSLAVRVSRVRLA
jgi:hypothetical protein